MTLLYKAFGEVGNNTLNSVNSLSDDLFRGCFGSYDGVAKDTLLIGAADVLLAHLGRSVFEVALCAY